MINPLSQMVLLFPVYLLFGGLAGNKYYNNNNNNNNNNSNNNSNSNSNNNDNKQLMRIKSAGH